MKTLSVKQQLNANTARAFAINLDNDIKLNMSLDGETITNPGSYDKYFLIGLLDNLVLKTVTAVEGVRLIANTNRGLVVVSANI